MKMLFCGILLVTLVTSCYSHGHHHFNNWYQKPQYTVVPSRLVWEWHEQVPYHSSQHFEQHPSISCDNPQPNLHFGQIIDQPQPVGSIRNDYGDYRDPQPVDPIGDGYYDYREPLPAGNVGDYNSNYREPSAMFKIRDDADGNTGPIDLVEEVFGEDRAAPPNQNSLPGAAAPVYTETDNPCTKKVNRKSYKKPGRRISEEMCLEYIATMKARRDKTAIDEACADYRKNVLKETLGSPYVAGGRLAEPGEFLHMGAIGFKAVDGGWVFKCGASIISERFVVTAGHCIKSARDPKIANLVPEIVRIGAKNLTQVGLVIYPQDLKIVRIIPHPSYKSPKQYFDIALMEVQKISQFDENVQPACLWHLGTENIRGKVAASGWGSTEEGGKTFTTALMVGDIDLVDNSTCDELLRPMCNRYWCGLQDHQLCAGQLVGGIDACQGDSGGPLQYKIDLPASVKGRMYYLLGVTSFGFGCARSNSPGVYTKVSSFVDWIESIVWPQTTN